MSLGTFHGLTGRIFRGAICVACLACVLTVPRPVTAQAEQSELIGIPPFCGGLSTGITRPDNIDRRIVRLEVDFDKRRKWVKNAVRFIKSGSIIISEAYKKKFKGSVVAHYSTGETCRFRAKIRISGDGRDHLTFEDGQILSSLDIRLQDGHLFGVVRFKLFIPATRVGKNEVVMANLLRTAGYLAPRTSWLRTDVMGRRHTLIFQENPVKEFLEYNGMREGPVVEGDERFGWSASRLNFDASLSYTRLENRKWAARGPTSLQIATQAVEKLNTAHIKQKYVYYGLGNESALLYLDNDLLADGDVRQRDRMNVFDAILTSAIAPHSFYPNNRKFYFDPIYGFFRPIYYDGNVQFENFGKLTPHHILRSAVDGAAGAIETLRRIDRPKFMRTLRIAGLETSRSELDKIFRSMLRNLEILSKFDAPDFSSVAVPANTDPLKYARDKFTGIVAVSPATRGGFDACYVNTGLCEELALSIKQRADLLSGDLETSGRPTVFQGSEKVSETAGSETRRSSLTLAPGAEIMASPGIAISEDASSRTISIRQTNADDWIVFRGGTLKDVAVVFQGVGDPSKPVPAGQRFNTRLITGCLTLVDTDVSDLAMTARRLVCEDGINLVRVNGTISSVDIRETGSDGLDVDFSNVRIGDIRIRNAGNDCVDFSAGNSYVARFSASGCGDKALSVGEGSHLEIDTAEVSQANTAVAVKDSSTLTVSSLTAKDVKSCLLAYRKKQEFSGAYARAAVARCGGGIVRADPGSAVEADQGS